MGFHGLEINGLRFSYPSYGAGGENDVLDGTELALEEGSSGAVFAGADAGKSTLARIIAGLIPRFTGGSLSGRVRFGERSISELRPFELTDVIGAVYQNPDDQLISTRCDTEAAFALESLGVPRPRMQQRVASALELMGLSGFAARNPATLSGGEKKRLLLSCLAAIDPELWILDESLEELDRSWKIRLFEYLKKRGRTVLFLDSRWSALYSTYCSRFSVLRAGRIALSERPESPRIAEALAVEGLVLPEPARPRDTPREGSTLRAEDISFRFQGSGAFCLDIESLELEKGIVCALTGDNGSGKSTLGRILCGLLVPEKGSVSMHDRSGRRSLSPENLKRRVGYMFQNPDYQIFLGSVREELALGLRYDKRRDGSIEEAIRAFNLPPGGTPPALMSYGARKRLQAATYHLLRRDYLILDETDSGLSYREYLSLLSVLAQGGAGILLITHDMALARAVSDRLLLMEGGRITHELSRESFSELGALNGMDG
jgi:energy-coupling factor transporter ATP-binding protein EcfA2